MGVLMGRLPLMLFGLAVWLSSGSAAAQGRIMLLDDSRLDDSVRLDVSDALSEFSRVSDERFVQAANSQRLDPLSEAAFSRALPADLVDVAVVLLPARRGLTMVLRSGSDGSVLSQHTLKLRRGKLRRKELQSIPRFVQSVMAKLPPASAEVSADTAEKSVEEQTARSDDLVEDERAVGNEHDTLSEQPSDDAESVDIPAVADEPSTSDEEEPRLLRLHVDLGSGLSSRTLEFPIEAGKGSLSVGPSAAFDVGLEAAYDPPSAVSWGIQLRYQTTVGARVDEHQIGGVERPMGIRSARFEALFVPAIDVSDVVQLRPAIGYGLRGLRTHAHDQASSTVHSLQTPEFTLSGPVAQIALRLALGDSVALSLVPEAQLLVSVGSDLKQRGVGGTGFAFGGMASLVVRVSKLLSVYLAYRQAHARIAGEDGKPNVSDGERYITAGLRGTP
jgi:hypothetical protein